MEKYEMNGADKTALEKLINTRNEMKKGFYVTITSHGESGGGYWVVEIENNNDRFMGEGPTLFDSVCMLMGCVNRYKGEANDG